MTDFNMTDVTGDGQRFAWPLLDRQDENFVMAHMWLVPPAIRLEGGRLRYGDFDRDGAAQVKAPSAKLLADFVALVAATPADILRFAKRWGVMGFCQHQADERSPLVMGHQRHPSLGGEPCRLVGVETLESWRRYASLFGDLLGRCAVLQKGQSRARRSKSVELETFLLHCDWIGRYFGCLRPVLVAENGRFDIKLGGGFLATGLPAALTTQLFFTLAGASKLATCASCGALFTPRRRPSKGRNSYCQNCGIRAAWREAQRRRREKGGQNEIRR